MPDVVDIFKVAAPYGGGVALAAAAIAVGARVYLAQAKLRLEAIKSAPKAKRADLVGSETASLGLTTKDLSPDQKFVLVQQVLLQRSERAKLLFYFALVVAIMLGALAFVSLVWAHQTGEPTLPAPSAASQATTTSATADGGHIPDGASGLPPTHIVIGSPTVINNTGSVSNVVGSVNVQLPPPSPAPSAPRP